jgi:HAD superfamily hydrolase (TIGR01549 family)
LAGIKEQGMPKIRAIFLDCGDTLVDQSTEVKDEHQVSQKADLIPGAAELVRELKQRGYTIALVADGPAGTFVNNLSPYGIYELFDAYAISGILGVEKPHPQMFQHALDALGIQPESYKQVIMVGNNLERDIKGANGMGLISVWLDWNPQWAKPHADSSEMPQYTIKQPLELLTLLDTLEAMSALG